MWKFIKQYFMPIYSSEIDQFLQRYDKANPELSASQLKEKAKFQRIYQLRDTKADQDAVL